MPRSNASRWFTRLVARARSWSRDLSNRSLAVCLAVGVFASLVILLRPPVLFDFLWEQDTRLQDKFFGWRDSLARVLHYEPIRAQEIAIVSIDSESAKKLGMSPPWPRQMYAQLLRQLKKAGASVVAFDLIFDGTSPLPESPAAKKGANSERYKKAPESSPPELSKSWVATSEGDDQTLTDALEAANNVVLATDVEVSTSLFAGRTKLLFHTPYQPFVLALESGTASLGNVVIEPDKDGVVRKADLVFSEFRHLNPFFYSFGLRIAEKYLQTRVVPGPGGNLYFYERIYPPSFRINYIGPSGSVTAVPFWKALDWERHYGNKPGGESAGKRGLSPDQTSSATNPFRDKIVLVGFHQFQSPETSERFTRARSMPFDGFLTPGSGVVRPMSGVELQANIVANVLTARYLLEPEWWEHVLIIMFVALLFGRIFAGLHGKPWSMLTAVGLFAVIWLVDAFLCFTYLNCVIPVIVPIFGVAFPAYFLVLSDQNLFAFRERRRHTKLFRSLASDRLASEIDRRVLGELGLEGKRATVTTLVCHMHDLNLLAGGRSPETVIAMVNQCLREAIASVYEYHGIVNRVSSQGVHALWGAPIPMKEESQARLAANCFLDIERRVSQLIEAWRREGLLGADEKAVTVQFAINTGPAICGQIGTETHTEYGALGEGIDLAIKFETLGPQYCSACVVGETTATLTSGQFELRELDKVKLDASGKVHRIYGLICHKGKIPGVLEETIVIYKQGLAAMEERNFSEAERLFNTALRLVPDDRPATIMRDRCRHFLDSPPEPNWDGATLVATE